MSQFETLTKYIPLIEQNKIGEWNIGENDDESFKQLPYVTHSGTINLFIRDVHHFIEKRGDLNLYQYKDILEKNNIGYDAQDIKDADISSLDSQCLVALIVGVILANRFSEGTLLRFLKEGYITKWLKRLEEMDYL